MPLDPRDVDLTKSAVRDLQYLAAHIEDFDAILPVARKIGPEPGIIRLAQRIAVGTNLPLAHVRDLLRALLNVFRIEQHFKVGTVEVVETLAKAIASSTDDKQAIELWNQKKTRIAAVVESLRQDDILSISEKAGRLAFTRQNLLKEAQILSDIRPVFTEDGSTITQAIVTHTLVLDFFDGTENRRMEFTLDAADVSALKRFCIRAEQKSITIKESLRSLPWKTVVFNEWDVEQPPAIESKK
jgi:hypothetical protein